MHTVRGSPPSRQHATKLMTQSRLGPIVHAYECNTLTIWQDCGASKKFVLQDYLWSKSIITSSQEPSLQCKYTILHLDRIRKCTYCLSSSVGRLQRVMICSWVDPAPAELLLVSGSEGCPKRKDGRSRRKTDLRYSQVPTDHLTGIIVF